MRARIAIVLLLLASTSGCCWTALDAQFVAAEVATYEAIGERYVKYVASDPALNDDDKATRIRTITVWKATLDEAQQ